MTPLYKWWLERKAKRRLAEIVAMTRESYATEQYRRRRAAALKGRAVRG